MTNILQEDGHRWDADEPHPDKRCFRCAIKRSYYLDFVNAGRRDLVSPCKPPVRPDRYKV